MIRHPKTLFICGILVLISQVLASTVSAQGFPYNGPTAPVAPEFDERGNPVQPGYESPGPPKRRSNAAGSRGTGEAPADYRAVRPYVQRPSSQGRIVAPANPQPPQYQPPPGGPTPVAATPSQPMGPNQPGSTFRERPDCSAYPMMIAQARSQGEMQGLAKEYLTCLIGNGWDMEQAKKQVITTIETTYLPGR